MSIMPLHFVPHKMKTNILKIYSYENKTLCGTLMNPYYEHEMPFSNFIQLLFLMDHVLSVLHHPQESMARRSFQDNSDSDKFSLPETPSPSKTPMASFWVNILFRQNASWQGSIIWLEKEMESQFRSVLELVLLMDNVLTTSHLYADK